MQRLSKLSGLQRKEIDIKSTTQCMRFQPNGIWGGNDGNRVLEAVKTVIVKMNFNDEDKNCRVGSCG